MNPIKNLKIRDKLLLLLFLLLLPLAYFVVQTLRTEVEENNHLKVLADQLEESQKISDYIHEFQKERAATIAAALGDPIFYKEAVAQRVYTDAAQEKLFKHLENTENTFSELNLIKDLNIYRQDLDQNRLEILTFRNYSTNLIMRLLGRLDQTATGINNVQIRRELLSYQNVIEAKVYLGRIRSLLMKVILEDKFSYADYGQYVSNKNAYFISLSDFNQYASQESVKEIQALLTASTYKEIATFFQYLDNNPDAKLNTYQASDVYALFSKTLEQYKLAEDHMINNIRDRVLEESSQKEKELIILSLLLFLILLLVTLLSFYIINLISSSLSALRLAADRIRLGATDVAITINSTDEIGQVADAFRGVVDKTIYLSKLTQAIGEGKYDMPVEVQSKDDTLSMAIQDMKEKLQRFTTDNANRSWVLSGISDLNNLITGENNSDKVSQEVLNYLCEYTNSEAGIFYLHNDSGTLIPSATYGINRSLSQIASFKIGAGKLGQVVSEQKPKVLEQVPEEYMKIETGLTSIEPVNVLLLPMVFSSTVVGAIELCSRRKYTPLDMEFFRNVSDRIAIVIHTLRSHLQTQELLYETQNQAEELETQQEELRQLNAELKASEEELKVSQEELQEKNSELEEKAQLLEEQFEAVRTKNQALEDAREAIELKMQQVETVSKYKSEFLANMSHELRTPLNSILILSRLLADNKEDNLTEKQAEHAAIIHKSGGDLLRLINEILDLSKIEAGQIRLEMEELSVKDLQLENTFTELARNKSIEFEIIHALNGQDKLTTDKFRLEQILKNFLGNAIKFTPEGGKVEFSVYPVTNKTKFKSEQLQETDDILAFAVKDTGIGIAKDKQEVVFEAFQQADTSTTRKFGGTGLGLAISKELAALLGGEIVLESQLNVGSTFTLYLPRHAKVTVTKKPAHTRPEVITQRPASVTNVLDALKSKDKKEITVLIVEDDKGFSGILSDFALAKNFKVLQAYTGQQGLEMAREFLPDAILLDINLPDISGWEVLQEIREDKQLRHVNVHVMSAYDREIVDEYQQNEEYLPKPVTLEMLNKAFSVIANSSENSIESTLIVEDNEIENRAVAELLLAHGIKSTSAFSAEEAEKILAKQKIDCIILDLNLPGMKGHQWMEKIRAKKGLSDIPIVVYSGKDLSEDEESKLKRFANTIIIKNEHSYIRLLDEVQLFLHKVNQKLPLSKDFSMKLHVSEEILRNKKVLLVDDDVRNVYSISSLLELQGMKIVVAYNGKEALHKLETDKNIDIVLMDVMMPEMDGIEATRQIRQNYQLKHLPIIALTAKAMKGDRERCIQAGASDYIPKPVDSDKLLTLMRVWLYEA